MGGIAGIGRVVSRFVKQFIREERANVAMIFALSFVALVSAAGAGIDLVPERTGFRKGCQFGAIAGLRDLLPGGDSAVVLDLFQSAEHRLVG